MPHDQLFKELINAFFREFVELFFPQIAARIDFSRVEFLDSEVFTDIPEGDARRPDVVAKVWTLEGMPEILLYHIEVQATRNKSFPYRMFEYYALLRLRHKLPVLPSVLYLTPGAGGLTTETYTESLFGQDIVSFRYHVIGLPDLHVEDWQAPGNPLAGALHSGMKVSKHERVARKLASVREVFESRANEAQSALLLAVIDNRLQLSAQEDQEMETTAKANPEPIADKYFTTVHAWGMHKALLRQMKLKFGEVPSEIEFKVRTTMQEDKLLALADRIITAETLQDMQLTEN
jgi:hypothetical protein